MEQQKQGLFQFLQQVKVEVSELRAYIPVIPATSKDSNGRDMPIDAATPDTIAPSHYLAAAADENIRLARMAFDANNLQEAHSKALEAQQVAELARTTYLTEHTVNPAEQSDQATIDAAYQELEINSADRGDLIKVMKAYRAFVKIHHPDKRPADGGKRFRKIDEAKKLLEKVLQPA